MIAWPAISGVLQRTCRSWFEIKDLLANLIGLSHDALHVLMGVPLQLLLAALLRVSVRSVWPLIIVLTLEMANEWNDLQIASVVWPNLAVQWAEGAKDVLLTMVLPTCILLLARYRPQLFR